MQLYGIIGWPLDHSLSPELYAQRFMQDGVEAVYKKFPISDIAQLPTLLRDYPILGLNVTSPYKEVVIPYLNFISKEAKAIGAVNTIKVVRQIDGSYVTYGHNTDEWGFRTSLQNLSFVPSNALVFGTGGASKAVIYALNRCGISVNHVSRSLKNGIYKTYSQLSVQDISQHLLLINATPLGMYPNIDSQIDIPYDGITSQHCLYDLIYNPEETAFLKKGKQFGATIINGKEMFELQGKRSWDIIKQSSIINSFDYIPCLCQK